MIIGLVFMVLPGPGIPFVIAGLAILASEFAWAEVLLNKTKHHSKKILDNLVRIANLIGAKKFEISGHTDSAGNSAMNQKLKMPYRSTYEAICCFEPNCNSRFR